MMVSIDREMNPKSSQLPCFASSVNTSEGAYLTRASNLTSISGTNRGAGGNFTPNGVSTVTLVG